MSNPNTAVEVPIEQALHSLLSTAASPETKIHVVQTALESPEGEFWRRQLGEWAARIVPVELLVPEVHREWRPLVHEAIVFVVTKLSPARLAPKIIEQMILDPELSPEVRLLRFLAKVPGLQKIGQVLARNRQLHPRLRRALIKLENGIADVSFEEINAIIRRDLEAQMEAYDITLAPTILSEASVSAVVRFTWRNPATRRRERGVFKVLKPYIASCYAEDMTILAQLARHLARKRNVTGVKLGSLVQTLTEIRLLLEREVDFPREQATLEGALSEYRALSGVRVPQLIPMLSTATITALSFEKGGKVTEVRRLPGKLRLEVAESLAKTLLAVPALSHDRNAVFHADPHAGNLLYDKQKNELVILDWALTERLTRKQRRNVVLLVLMMILRDADGMAKAIDNLCELRAHDPAQSRTVRAHVERLLETLPFTKLPGPIKALRLLDDIALDGIRFPAALLMFRKAAFTLEGVVQDTARSPLRIDSLMARHVAEHWRDAAGSLFLLLSLRDWMALEWSAFTFSSRICARALASPWHWFAGLATDSDAA